MDNGNMCYYCHQFKPLANRMICKSCSEEYTAIQLYIENHPHSNLMDVSNSTQISIKKI